MELIYDVSGLSKNLSTVEKLLSDDVSEEGKEVLNLIRRGTCFVAYNVGGEVRFAPSRFIGYIDNSLDKHSDNDTKHGSETNKAISNILGKKPEKNDVLEERYKVYCIRLGIEPNETGAFGNDRKYWEFELKEDFSDNRVLPGDFLEGKVVERKHILRERNSKVVGIAKKEFKEKNGKLFCEVCGFDFEKVYGQNGEDFIEGHHIIPVSKMEEGHRTSPNDIVMLCSNCHRMVHRYKRWLGRDELKDILIK